MDTATSRKFTLGFVFNAGKDKVLLVHKQRPDWQRGKVNGIGGKFEADETPQECIARETKEESGLDIGPSLWTHIGSIRQPEGDVEVLAAVYLGTIGDARKADHEEVEWFDVNSLPSNILTNLSWLVPLSIDKLRGKFQTFTVQY